MGEMRKAMQDRERLALEAIAAEMADIPGHLGFYYKNLVTGAAFGVREDEYYGAASVIKLPLFLHVLREVKAGRISLDQPIVTEVSDKVGGCGALKMFTHIKENQLFYNTYFKLCYDPSHQISVYDPARAMQEFGDTNIKYHVEFFRHGFNAIIKLWLAGGCQESPEEMAEILKQEYRGR